MGTRRRNLWVTDPFEWRPTHPKAGKPYGVYLANHDAPALVTPLKSESYKRVHRLDQIYAKNRPHRLTLSHLRYPFRADRIWPVFSFIPANPEMMSSVRWKLNVRWIGFHFFFSFEFVLPGGGPRAVRPARREVGSVGAKTSGCPRSSCQNSAAAVLVTRRATASDWADIGRLCRLAFTDPAAPTVGNVLPL
jgi:hypothetical protein